MEMISTIILISLTILVDGKKIKYYSNFKFEKIVYGQEDAVFDFLTLADDPKGNLPESYTSCSSVSIKIFTTDDILVIQMLKQNGTPWYRLSIGARNYETMSETLTLWYDDPASGKVRGEFFSSSHIPIVPHSWYHICKTASSDS